LGMIPSEQLGELKNIDLELVLTNSEEIFADAVSAETLQKVVEAMDKDTLLKFYTAELEGVLKSVS
ncbi:MAG TPA: hypothetical protein DF383_11810, partial [Deltaproteobacteria bacterium]|nr:hypothetical protein [Deltaproteobacteria bacterium]